MTDLGAHVGKATAERVKADCRRRQVGCVIVGRDGSVVGRGHNRSRDPQLSCLAGDCPRGRLSYEEQPAFVGYDTAGRECLAIHAEEMALAEAGPAAYGATVYVTCRPCDGCATALARAGVAMVIVEDA